MDAESIFATCGEVCDAIANALSELADWGEAGTRPGQYKSDLVADAIGVEILLKAGFGVLSEESGLHEQGRDLLAVIDPVDGSTNASRGIPWYATSICVLDGEGPLIASVMNQANGTHYEAERGGGAMRDGTPIHASGSSLLSESIIAVSGYPATNYGWRQFRALGAAALDLCAVADGTLDGYVDCIDASHGPWDYLGGLLVCREAEAVVREAQDRELIVRGHSDRRSPVAAATAMLLDELIAARQVQPSR